MKKTFPVLVSLCVYISTALAGFASGTGSPWTTVAESEIRSGSSERLVVPSAYRVFRLDRDAIAEALAKAPREFTRAALSEDLILELPMPDGTFQKFSIEHSPIVEEGLAKKYPELARTFRGQGIDDPTATVRLDLLPTGFHAIVLSTRGTILIDPYFKSGNLSDYIVYRKSDAPRLNPFMCEFEETPKPEFISDEFDVYFNGRSAEVISGTQLRQYRLALAATGEYTAAVGGGTVAGALAAQVLIMNRVNGVYERDLAIRMNVIANNDLLIYTDGATDPYSNSSGSTMLSENTTNINTVIGSANYDIGHVFSTGGGGVASLGVPCGANKARGVTGLSNPVGDAFAIDYVAHEMGHQWGANHTFNGNVSNCSGANRSAASAYEPGSGITIMAYAGICGNQDLARHSIDTFHVKSLEVIVAYSQTGNGNTCASTTATGNTPPSVTVVGGQSFNIPKQTPFTLTASATDANNDSVTYDWQEYDLGAATTGVPNTDSDGVAKPIFMPYLPTAGGSRTFPALTYILNNANVPPSTYDCGRGTGNPCLTGELLPAITRAMVFQVVARDNRANGGGINTATATVNVDGNSGPFAVTAPNTAVTVAGGSTQTVTWNVANTTAAPVSAANVKISLSTDGGQTFPTVLAASTANDGSEAVTVPNLATTTARIKIEAVGNIFFDISDSNFTISSSVVRRPFDFDSDGKTDISIFRPAVGEWWYLRSSDNGNRAFQFGASGDVLTPGDFTGDGKTDIAFYRNGTWFVLRSENASFYSFPFGLSTDVAVPADYDGDGKTDAAVFRASNVTWYIQNSGGGGTTIQPFGSAGDKPVPADYDGDGKADIAIYRPSLGQWWLNRSTAGIIAVSFGNSTDKPVPGDFTGDAKADIAFYRNGEWFVLRSENSTFYSFPFGTSTDTPAPGDYDGDGKIDGAVFRTSNNTWYVQRSTAGTLIQSFGATGDIAVPGVFVR